MEKLEKYLFDAVGKEKADLALDNPYGHVGFDEDEKRLGWIGEVAFSKIKETLEDLLPTFSGIENFIFIGMGGSINGIKPLISLFKNASFYTLDNLDPCAIEGILTKIDSLDKTLVISISKSGTTKETQLLSQTLREKFSNSLGPNAWSRHFLWVSDEPSFEKLDNLGWDKVKKVSIQFDKNTDIGGRFSSPHTLIFILPLFLLLGKDLVKLERIYIDFIGHKGDVRKSAYLACKKYKDSDKAYFLPKFDPRFGVSFSAWIVQLFQESLGSKSENLAVKTLTAVEASDDFLPLQLDLAINDSVALLMLEMYFFQVFIAYYSAVKSINFVNQAYVEKYKKKMQSLEKQSRVEAVDSIDLEDLVKASKARIKADHNFIEIVLYCYPEPKVVEGIKKRFEAEFPEKNIFVFLGSDWNHQSYQAAFSDKNTLYILLILPSYKSGLEQISKQTIVKNIETLKLIAKATYLTLEEKALFYSLSLL